MLNAFTEVQDRVILKSRNTFRLVMANVEVLLKNISIERLLNGQPDFSLLST